MAIYHLSFKICKRSDGKSSVYLSAYQNRQKYLDDRTGATWNYSDRDDLHHSEIMAPEQTPVELISNSSVLWNAIENIEKRKDAQLCRYFDVAIPIELNNDDKIKLVKDYVKENFIDEGMIADLAFHGLDSDNPHCHVMLTMREITAEGFGNKNRDWNDKEKLEKWRKNWATKANQQLKAAGHNSIIDNRSLKEQHKTALIKADKAPDNRTRAIWLCKAIETDRPAMKRIFRMDWVNGQQQRLKEQEIRDKARTSAKQTYKTIKDLDLQISITPDSIKLTETSPKDKKIPTSSGLGPGVVPGQKESLFSSLKNKFRGLVSAFKKSKEIKKPQQTNDIMIDPATGEIISKKSWEAGDVHDSRKGEFKSYIEKKPEETQDRFKSQRNERELKDRNENRYTL